MSKKAIEEVIPGNMRQHVKRWAAEYVKWHKVEREASKKKKEFFKKVQDSFNNQELSGVLGEFKLSSWFSVRETSKFKEAQLREEDPVLYTEYKKAKALVESVEDLYSEVEESKSFRIKITA